MLQENLLEFVYHATLKKIENYGGLTIFKVCYGFIRRILYFTAFKGFLRGVVTLSLIDMRKKLYPWLESLCIYQKSK